MRDYKPETTDFIKGETKTAKKEMKRLATVGENMVEAEWDSPSRMSIKTKDKGSQRLESIKKNNVE